MRVAGSSSWSVRTDFNETLHRALLVRELAGAAELRDTPPRLEPPLPDPPLDPSPPVSSQLLRRRWADWWRELCLWQAGIGPGIDFSDATQRQAAAAAQRRAWSAHGPELEVFAGGLGRWAQDWFEQARGRWFELDRPRSRERWETTRDAAELSAMELGVEPGALRACTQVLFVRGSWWQRPAPGLLLHSWRLQEDRELYMRLLRETFASGLELL